MCLNPLTIINPVRKGGVRKSDVSNRLLSVMSADRLFSEPHYVKVPCGHCEECLASKMSEYRRRLSQQLEMTPPKRRNFFFTLTFDDEHLSLIRTSKDLRVLFRNFLRRLNYYWFGDEQIRTPYFCASEFGQHPQTGSEPRLHLHAIIYNLPVPEYFGNGLVNSLIKPLWGQGFTWTGWFDGRSCKYVSKYVLKSYELNDDLHLVLCSDQLGLRPDFVRRLSRFTSWSSFVDLFPFGKYKVRKFPLHSEMRAAKQLMSGEQLYTLRIFINHLICDIIRDQYQIRKLINQIKLLCRYSLPFLKQRSRTCLHLICQDDFSPPPPPLRLCLSL